MDGVLLDKTRVSLVQCPAGKIGTYTLPSSIINVGSYSFFDCTNLTTVILPDGVVRIMDGAFSGCNNLTTLTIPSSVVSIGDWAFYDCSRLANIYFQGDAPRDPYTGLMKIGGTMFAKSNSAILYYLPGTTGWESTYELRPTVLSLPEIQNTDTRFGVRSNQFGFNINWAIGRVVIVEASEALADATWSPVGTNLLKNGTTFFSDPKITNFTSRLYRLRVQ
jgi:hypothetical protein